MSSIQIFVASMKNLGVLARNLIQKSPTITYPIRNIQKNVEISTFVDKNPSPPHPVSPASRKFPANKLSDPEHRMSKNVHFSKFAHEKNLLSADHWPPTTATHPPQPKVPSKKPITSDKTNNLLTPRLRNTDLDP
jgi:hypothetical protein